MVVAGLLHAVYESGSFADGATGLTEGHRRTVREAAGDDVEDLVAAYHGIRWNGPETRIAGSLGNADMRMRDVLLLRLANEIEDHLGHAMRLSSGDRTLYVGAREACLAIARGLGRPDIVEVLSAVYHESDGADWSPALALPHAASFRVPGPSAISGAEHFRLGVAAALRSLQRRTVARFLGGAGSRRVRLRK